MFWFLLLSVKMPAHKQAENKYTEYMTIFSAFNVYFIPIYANAGPNILPTSRTGFDTRKSTYASA